MTINILGVVILTGDDKRVYNSRVAVLKSFADRAERDAKNLLGIALQLQAAGQEPTTQGEEK